MTAYYNEFDPFAAAWLRELIKAGHIAQGDVDERSIEDVCPQDLKDYIQCHFFAGIGVWSYALRRAGWPDSRPVWTGSCPCQPFSAAGKRAGTADKRHLWPAWFELIKVLRPVNLFGEQVSSKDALTWLDLVQTDLEGEDYSFGSLDTCAAGFGAPHIRQRLYFVADRSRDGRREECQNARGISARDQAQGIAAGFESSRSSSKLADSDGRNTGTEGIQRSGEHGQQPEDSRASSTVVNSESEQMGVSRCARESRTTNGFWADAEWPPRGATNGFWSACDWLPCVDGKSRPVEPGTFPLAHGVANRVGLLRGYGNSLVAPVAQGFIEAFLETEKS